MNILEEKLNLPNSDEGFPTSSVITGGVVSENTYGESGFFGWIKSKFGF
jgi:hypothetical protein